MKTDTESGALSEKNGLKEETLLIHGDAAGMDASSVVPPIYYSATFAAADAADFADMANTPRHSTYYTRYGNPVHDRVAAILAELEQTETALVMASGMGAISTVMLALLSKGDHIIAQTRHYMGTAKLFDDVLPRFGIEVSLVEQSDMAAFEKAFRPNTKLVMLETPANPTLVVTDLAAIAELARKHGILTVADNTFASPLNQKPHTLGIDIVVHSATKYLGGHHDLIAGAVCCSRELAERIWRMHTLVGAVLSPMDAWLLLRGLRTLDVRMERINANALAVASWLESHPRIQNVYYPGLKSHPQHQLAVRQMRGFGAVIAFAVKGGYEETGRFVAGLKLATQAVSLGGVESLVVHTASMWSGTMNEKQMIAAGIPPNFVRMSVGLEHVEDIKDDLDAALSRI